MGASRGFPRTNPRVTLVGVICAPGNAVPGVHSEARLREIAFPLADDGGCHRRGRNPRLLQHSLALCRNGMMAGPSSGFALAGLLQFLRAHARRPRAWMR